MEMMPHSRNNFSNFEHPFKTFSSLLILMSQIQIPYSKSSVPKPHFCWLPRTNEGNVGKQTSPPLPMIRKATDCECLLPVSLPFRIARLHCTLLLGPKILRWSTSYWIMVLLQMLLIRSINLCFFGTVTKVQNNSCNIIVITINRTLIVITILYDRCHRHNLCLHYRCCQGDGSENNFIIHHQPLR